MIGCSHEAAEALFGKKCWHEKRVRIYLNAIDSRVFELLDVDTDRNEYRKKLSLPLDVPIIGHVGRFDVPKNHVFLMNIFKNLVNKIPKAQLVLVGDGPLKSDIEKLVTSYSLTSQTHLLGIRTDVPQIMNIMDLFLFPSLYEGLPVVLLEAQAAGLHCIVTDTITKDADIKLDMIHQVSIKADVEVWTETILKCMHRQRPSWSERKSALQKAGLDVDRLAFQIGQIYKAIEQ
jgi:glycosyltransferase EpsF